MRTFFLGLTLAFIAATPADAANTASLVGDVKIFRNWAAGCDNGGTCTMTALIPEEEGGYDQWGGPVSISRSGGESDEIVITARPDMEDERLVALDRYQMLVDGQVVDTGAIVKGDYPIRIAGADARKAMTAIISGRVLKFVGMDGTAIAQISLSGTSASLRYFDAVQKRAGTAAAMVAKGKKTYQPPVFAMPGIALPKLVPAGNIPDASDLVALAEQSPCKDERYGPSEDQAFPLATRDGSDTALVLVACGAGAYNFSSAAYIGSRKSPDSEWQFVSAQFDYSPGWTNLQGELPVLVNAYWDEEKNTLSSYAKGRGLGDCGSAEDYIWDGTSFRLIRASTMPECRGSWEWITTYRADVVKR